MAFMPPPRAGSSSLLKFYKMKSPGNSSTPKIRLFVKPYCGWCTKASRWLDDQDIEYTEIDVIADDAAYEEMVGLSGQTCAPVLDVDGESSRILVRKSCPDSLKVFDLSRNHAVRLIARPVPLPQGHTR